MAQQSSRWLFAGGWLVCGCLLLGVMPASAQWPWMSRSARIRAWLKAEHKKTQKDCEQLVKDSRRLRELGEEHKPDTVSPELFERLLALEKETLLLRADTQKIDENFLSVPVVTRAEEIRKEGKALQRLFEDKFPDRPGRELARLADDIEDRADDIADRMRLP